ncbi:hypothetical protein NC653_006388 [Populus alba x Populus x berolinensis]|uniref:Uncharacterized protein n=1 Tax=Populus alba x Populus x berolinensis TaxID=444605 RepID=A0AAD6WC43_9ROSI|nr:hypothetical protein NC653_006388 [Populus alba x Populus x berolinensis]
MLVRQYVLCLGLSPDQAPADFYLRTGLKSIKFTGNNLRLSFISQVFSSVFFFPSGSSRKLFNRGVLSPSPRKLVEFCWALSSGSLSPSTNTTNFTNAAKYEFEQHSVLRDTLEPAVSLFVFYLASTTLLEECGWELTWHSLAASFCFDSVQESYQLLRGSLLSFVGLLAVKYEFKQRPVLIDALEPAVSLFVFYPVSTSLLESLYLYYTVSTSLMEVGFEIDAESINYSNEACWDFGRDTSLDGYVCIKITPSVSFLSALPSDFRSKQELEVEEWVSLLLDALEPAVLF